MASGKVHTSDRTRPYKQDLPPKGGYSPITFKRIPAKTVVNTPILVGGFLAAQLYGAYMFKKNQKRRYREDIEMGSATNALEPMLLAERDRGYMKHLRKLREYEAEVMKDVPGWEVGTWFGQPVYKCLDEDEFHGPSHREFYIFSRPWFRKREAYHYGKLVAV